MQTWQLFSKSANCLILKARLLKINAEIDFMKKYIENAENGGVTFAANYFRQKLPSAIAEREALEAQLEFSGCGEN